MRWEYEVSYLRNAIRGWSEMLRSVRAGGFAIIKQRLASVGSSSRNLSNLRRVQIREGSLCLGENIALVYVPTTRHVSVSAFHLTHLDP